MSFWYVDPRIAPGDESDAYDGGFGVGKLRDSWADVTWTAGDFYYQARGSLYVGGVTIGNSGSAGSLITIGAYGEGDFGPRINGNGSSTGCFYATGRSYIDISGGYELYGATGFPAGGLHFLNCSNITAREFTSHTNEYGVRIDNTSASEQNNFTIEDFLVRDAEQTGFVVVCGTSSGGIIRGVTIRRGRILNSGRVFGTTTRYGFQANSRIGDAAYDATRVVHGLYVDDLAVDGAPGYGVFLRGVTGGYFRHGEVTRAGSNGLEDTHSLWLGGCLNMNVIGNVIHNNGGWVGGSIGSGVGIFVDQFSPTAGGGCSYISVCGNHVYEQFRGEHSGVFPSAGIYIYRGTNSAIVGNYCHDLRNGVAVRGATTQNAVNNRVYHNTVDGIDDFAYSVSFHADATDLRNNIAKGATVGFFAESGASAATNVTRQYNCSYAMSQYAWATGTLASLSAGSAGTGDIETDPLLNASGHLLAGSPCIGEGIYISGARHMGGAYPNIPPDMGASRYESARSVTTRSVVPA